ncbi:ATP-dependent zinc protease [Waterburya agarophytonicola K14]|uniref:ATP-dependent zinc protease n=1 Tax=Waterburya agarophytonicola KI4 TaxID=2874699 RepID=A0A964BT24_9CYAN|nr:ATP-dependent zinc protease [Waterburya agarophytonicola KI4]
MSKNLKSTYYNKSTQDRAIIGWREIIALPQLKIDWVKAKIDTGARSSAIHAFEIEELTIEGKSFVRFQVHPLQRDDQTIIVTQAELLEYREVKNSGGKAELRPVIVTEVKLGQQQWQIELTLTNRDVMGFRMLLGRQAVRNKFLVDPGKSFLQSDREHDNNRKPE